MDRNRPMNVHPWKVYVRNKSEEPAIASKEITIKPIIELSAMCCTWFVIKRRWIWSRDRLQRPNRSHYESVGPLNKCQMYHQFAYWCTRMRKNRILDARMLSGYDCNTSEKLYEDDIRRNENKRKLSESYTDRNWKPLCKEHPKQTCRTQTYTSSAAVCPECMSLNWPRWKNQPGSCSSVWSCIAWLKRRLISDTWYTVFESALNYDPNV